MIDLWALKIVDHDDWVNENMNNSNLTTSGRKYSLHERLACHFRHAFVMGLLLLPGSAQSAVIVFNTSANISGDANVLNVGAPQFAYKWSSASASTTVNGVTFTRQTGGTGAVGDLNLSNLGAVNGTAFTSGSNPFNALSANYKGILVGAVYNSPGGVTATTTINGLTSGHQYAVQVWVGDPRSGGTITRTETITGANAQPLDFNVGNVGGGVGQYTIGIVTADGTAPSFTLVGNVLPQMNAIQVRDVTNIGYWTGTNGATWDAATTANFANNLYSAALNTTTFATAKAPLNGVTFADHYWNTGATVGVTQSAVTVAAGGVSTGNLYFQNNSVDYTIASSDANGISSTTALNVLGGGKVTLVGTHAYNGATRIQSGTLQLGNGVTDGTINSSAIVNNGALMFETVGSLTRSAVLSGSGTVTKNGAGTQALSGANITYTGATTVNAGILVFSNTTALNTSIANQATVEINATSGDSWILNNGRTLSGAGTWIKTGTGRASFNNTTLTTTGQFLIQAGTLRNNNNASNWSGSTADMDISAGAILDLYADPIYVDRLTAGPAHTKWVFQ